MLIDRAFNAEHGFSIRDKVGILYSDTDPTSGSGFNEPAGSVLIQVPTSGEPIIWTKFGSGAKNWKKLGIASYTSSSAPTANNDGVDTAALGRTFLIGDFWVKTSATVGLYFCSDNSTGAAVWNTVGGGSADNSFSVTQSSHGFSVLTPIYLDSGVWKAAKADDELTLATHVIVEITGINDFKAAGYGRFTVTGHGLTAETIYFVSASSAGVLTSTEPAVGYSNPILLVEDANTVHVLPYRSNKIAVVGNMYSNNTGQRQTALTGQVSTSTGRANYLSAGTGLAVTLTASSTDPWVGSWANGFGNATADLIASLTSTQTNAFASLTNFANPYLYVENNGTGSLTYSHSNYKPYTNIVFYGYKVQAILAHFEGTNGATTFTDTYNNVWTLSNSASISTTQYKYGTSSVRLASTTQCADVTCPTLPPRWTWECNFRLDAMSGTQYIFGAGWPAGFLVLSNGTTLNYYLSSNNSTWDILSAGAGAKTNLAATTWYHLAVVFDGSMYNFYLDGVLDYCQPSTTAIYQPLVWRLGYDASGGYSAVGYYDEFRFSPYARYLGNFTALSAAHSPDELHFYNLNKQAMYKGDPTTGWTKTYRLFTGECKSGFVNDGLYTTFTPTIGTTNTNVAYPFFRYCISATGYRALASAAGVALTATTVPTGKWGLFGWEIGTDGTIHQKDAAANSTGYDSEALALAAIPTATASHVLFMYITVMKSDGNFVGATTALNAANTTVYYYTPTVTNGIISASVLTYDLQNGFFIIPQQSTTGGALINGNLEIQM